MKSIGVKKIEMSSFRKMNQKTVPERIMQGVLTILAMTALMFFITFFIK